MARLNFFPKNKRGQAAVTDALFFFTVASGLALFLYVFASGYGATLNSQSNREQFNEYTASALKVILYSSTPRNSDCTLQSCPSTGNPPEEIDFLMAAVKEDFADDGGLNETGVLLKNTVRAIMQPLSSSADYVFFLYMPNQSGNLVPYFLYYKSDFFKAGDSTAFNASNCVSGDATIDALRLRAGGCHSFYYCKPTNLDAINRFLFTLPELSRTSARTIFLSAPTAATAQPSQIPTETHFLVWPSASVDNATEFAALHCEKSITVEADPNLFFQGSGIAGGLTLRSGAQSPGSFEFSVRNTLPAQANVQLLLTDSAQCPLLAGASLPSASVAPNGLSSLTVTYSYPCPAGSTSMVCTFKARDSAQSKESNEVNVTLCN